MYVTHGKTIHFCRNDQAQKSSTTKPNWVRTAHTQISAQLKQLEPIPIKSQLVQLD